MDIEMYLESLIMTLLTRDERSALQLLLFQGQGFFLLQFGYSGSVVILCLAKCSAMFLFHFIQPEKRRKYIKSLIKCLVRLLKTNFLVRTASQ